MYPTIYHAVLDLIGWDWPWLKMLNSFGFFVALAFVTANYLLMLEMKRKESLGLFPRGTRTIVVGMPVQWKEVAFNALLGFLFGWKVLYLLMNASTLFQPGSMPQEHIFSMQGNVWLGILLAIGFGGYKYWEYKKNELPEPQEKEVAVPAHEYVGPITFAAAVGGIVGAKFFHLFENPAEFMKFFQEPSLENFLSGLTVYGGLIMGAFAVWLYARPKGLKFIHLADATAPGLMLAYGIGRIGCQVSGDGDWGIP
ncbi:MAG: prolipoprotein diacylglyceryl transferase, partial [Flavobacteriales bacterium]|nr:prolipoprotein diacylglyceryl transferase [Flavobacteriales bacterium]